MSNMGIQEEQALVVAMAFVFLVTFFIVLIYTAFALAIFIYNDQVNFKFGLILAAGSMMGAFVGARFAVKWGPKFVRYLLLVVLIVAAVKMFMA